MDFKPKISILGILVALMLPISCSRPVFELLYSESGLTGTWTLCQEGAIPIRKWLTFSENESTLAMDYVMKTINSFEGTCGPPDFTEVFHMNQLATRTSEIEGVREMDAFGSGYGIIPKTIAGLTYLQFNSSPCITLLSWQIGVETDAAECYEMLSLGSLHVFYYYIYWVDGDSLLRSIAQFTTNDRAVVLSPTPWTRVTSPQF